MGTYLSRNEHNVAANESQELNEKICNQDITIRSKFIDAKHDRSRVNTNGEEDTTKSDSLTNECSNMLAKVQIELLEYPSTTSNVSSDKIDNSTLESDDYRDQIIDLRKLLAQLLNAKVVLTRLEEEPLIKSYQRSSRQVSVTRSTSVHTNVDLDDEKIVGPEKNSKDCTYRYCAKCKKTVFARVEDSKNCSDCKKAMTYLCTKCNVKHYKRYGFFLSHRDRCNGNGTPLIDRMDDDDVDEAESSIEDKSATEADNDSTSALDEDQFIVKQKRGVNPMKMYVRYCSECDEVAKNSIGKCIKCGNYLLYSCKKCKAKYNLKPSMLYHMRNQCYPANKYQCTHCDYTTNTWGAMRKHFVFMHTNRPFLKCKLCSYGTKYKQSLKIHIEKKHLDETIEPNIEDTSTEEANIDSTVVLGEKKTLVKRIEHKKCSGKYYNRYCSNCDIVVMTSQINRCRTCKEYLNFACKKCNEKFNGHSGMTYHIRNHCYPTKEYRCTQCTLTTRNLPTLRRHFKSMHTKRPSYKCKLCSHETKYKQNLKVHVESCHRDSITDMKFHCKSCKFSTNFPSSLRRHQETRH